MNSRLVAVAGFLVCAAMPEMCRAQTVDNGATYTLENEPIYTHTTTHPDPHTGHYQSRLPLFATPEQAERHCPNDMVVWLDTRTGQYRQSGRGRTRIGGYVCVSEADDAADLPDR